MDAHIRTRSRCDLAQAIKGKQKCDTYITTSHESGVFGMILDVTISNTAIFTLAAFWQKGFYKRFDLQGVEILAFYLVLYCHVGRMDRGVKMQ